MDLNLSSLSDILNPFLRYSLIAFSFEFKTDDLIFKTLKTLKAYLL